MPPALLRRLLRAVLLALAVGVTALALQSAARADDAPADGDRVVGELVQAWPEHQDAEDSAERGDHGPLSWIATEDGDSVRVPTADVADLPLGATVEVTLGGKVRDPGSREDGLAPAQDVVDADVLQAPDPPATAPAAAPYTDEVTVVRVAPAGLAPDGTAVTTLVDAVDGPVADFWEAQSGGAIRLHATAGAAGWISSSVSCSSPMALWQDVQRQIRFVPDAGKHLLLYIPQYPAQMPACAYGLAQVSPTRSYGGYAYVRDTTTSVIAHELGHNFGLNHSSLRQCDGSADAGSCQVQSYYDLYDVMGASWTQLGSLNAVQADALGVLPASQRQDVASGTAGGTYTLSPLSSSSGIRAIRITAATGAVYWVEFRTPSGADSWLGSAANYYRLDAGVTIRRASGPPDSSLLLDGTPSARGSWNTDLQDAVTVGRSVAIAGGEWRVRVNAATPSAATVSVQFESPITTSWLDGGGAGGPLGNATSGEVCGLVGGGCHRTFQNGDLYWTAATGVHQVDGDLLAAWLTTGGPDGPLGWPTSDRVPVPGGTGQAFQGGSVYSSTGTGAHAVRGDLRAAWWGRGGVTGALGFPAGEQVDSGDGAAQEFSGGTLYWSRSAGAHALGGDFRTVFEASGGLAGPLGSPLSDVLTVPGGTAAAFQGGSIYSTPAAGTHVVRGAIRAAWWLAGGLSGPLGFPTSEPTTVPGGLVVTFQGGAIYESPATGAHVVTGPLHDDWVSAGGASGILGFPTTDVLFVHGGLAQVFQNGSIYWSATTGAHFVAGAVRTAWWASGGIDGPLGFPTSDYASIPGGWAAAFQRGSVYESTATGGHVVRGDILSAWWSSGGTSGPLGFPTTDLLSVPGGRAQAFSGGSVYASDATGAAALPYSFLVPWWTTGGVTGPFGFPTTGVLTVPGGTAAAFQGGSVYSSAGTGSVGISGAIRTAWWAAGGVSGPLGFPTGASRGATGRLEQAFTGGVVVSAPSAGAHAVAGDFLTAWDRVGGAGGVLGLPLTDLLPVPGGTAQAFTGGSLYAASGQPAHAIYGPTLSTWWSTGGVSGPLGFPAADTTAVGTGSATRFTGGLVAGTGRWTFSVGQDFADAVDRVGGLEVVGLPISVLLSVPGGTAQAFEKASVYLDTAVDGGGTPCCTAHVVSGPLRTAWWAAGGVSGPHGFPVGDIADTAGSTGAGQSLSLADGTLYWSAATGVHFVESGVDAAYRTAGGPSGPLGWPTSDTYDGGGQRRGDFQGGSLP